MPLITADDYIDRRASGYDQEQDFRVEAGVATTNVYTRTGALAHQRLDVIYKAASSLPSGVTAFNPVSLQIGGSTVAAYMLARLTNFGSINIGTNTFTDGSAMPSRTEGNTSNQISSPILLEVTTALNATPGNLVVTYVDQDNNAAQAATSIALTASAVAGSMQFLQLTAPDNGAIDVTNMVQSAGTTPSGIIKAWGVECLDIIMAPFSTQMEMGNYLTSFPFVTPLGVNDEIVLIGFAGSATKAAFGRVSLIGEKA